MQQLRMTHLGKSQSARVRTRLGEEVYGSAHLTLVLVCTRQVIASRLVATAIRHFGCLLKSLFSALDLQRTLAQ